MGIYFCQNATDIKQYIYVCLANNTVPIISPVPYFVAARSIFYLLDPPRIERAAGHYPPDKGMRIPLVVVAPVCRKTSAMKAPTSSRDTDQSPRWCNTRKELVNDNDVFCGIIHHLKPHYASSSSCIRLFVVPAYLQERRSFSLFYSSLRSVISRILVSHPQLSFVPKGEDENPTLKTLYFRPQ